MSINLEKISIILEMVSFFLVTIDLLGRKRIEILQHRFENRMAAIKSVDLKGVATSQPFLAMDRMPGWVGKCAVFLLFQVSLIVSLVVWVILMELIAHLTGLEWIIILAIPLTGITAYYLTFFFRFLLRNVVYVMVGILELIVDGLFTGILSLFNRLKLEGVMLIGGAMLFLLSKILAYLNAGYK
jgi:hypothetical protein